MPIYQFNRRAELDVAGFTLKSEDIRFTFNVQRSASDTPKSTINIYNLKQETGNRIISDGTKQIVLRAGYENISVIYKGRFDTGEFTFQGTETILKLETKNNNASSNISNFNNPIRLRTVISYLAEQLSLSVVNIELIEDETLPNYISNTSPVTQLRDLLNERGYTFSIDNERLVFSKDSEVSNSGENIQINENTGLIDHVKITTDDQNKREVFIKSLLNPRLQIGSQVIVKDGTFKVNKLDFRGDTFGNGPFTAEITAV